MKKLDLHKQPIGESMGFMNRSKMLFTVAAGIGLSTSAFAGPTVYGLINKEIRSVSQDADANKVSKINVTDVDGFETRIGVKGNMKDDRHDIDYKIELGLNSNGDSAGSNERLRMRLAFIKMKHNWGNITIGQNWTPNSVRMIQLDPFSGTGLQSYSLDQSMINGANSAKTVGGGVGFRMRYFQDQISFQSKDMNGFRYHLTIDDNGETAANIKGTDDDQFTSHTITWDKKFGSLTNNLTVSLFDKSAAASGAHKEKNVQIGNKMMFGNHSVSLAYGTQTTGDDGKNKRMFAAWAMNMDKSKVAVSYSNLDLENAAGTKTGSDSMLALGWFHKCSDMLTVRATAGQYTVKKETADTFGGGFATNKSENKGTIIALGAGLSF